MIEVQENERMSPDQLLICRLGAALLNKKQENGEAVKLSERLLCFKNIIDTDTDGSEILKMFNQYTANGYATQYIEPTVPLKNLQGLVNKETIIETNNVINLMRSLFQNKSVLDIYNKFLEIFKASLELGLLVMWRVHSSDVSDCNRNLTSQSVLISGSVLRNCQPAVDDGVSQALTGQGRDRSLSI